MGIRGGKRPELTPEQRDANKMIVEKRNFFNLIKDAEGWFEGKFRMEYTQENKDLAYFVLAFHGGMKEIVAELKSFKRMEGLDRSKEINWRHYMDRNPAYFNCVFCRPYGRQALAEEWDKVRAGV